MVKHSKKVMERAWDNSHKLTRKGLPFRAFVAVLLLLAGHLTGITPITDWRAVFIIPGVYLFVMLVVLVFRFFFVAPRELYQELETDYTALQQTVQKEPSIDKQRQLAEYNRRVEVMNNIRNAWGMEKKMRSHLKKHPDIDLQSPPNSHYNTKLQEMGEHFTAEDFLKENDALLALGDPTGLFSNGDKNGPE